MSATKPRLGVAAGIASVSLATVATLVLWAPLTQAVVLLPPALLCALVAFAHRAWRLAATGLCLCLSVGAAIASLVNDFLPWRDVLIFAPMAVSLGLAVWLGVDYGRKRDTEDVHRLPAWLEAVRGSLGIVVGAASLTMALGSLASAAWPMVMVAELLSRPDATTTGAATVFLSGTSSIAAASVLLAPLALLGALTAWACGAWRLAVMAAFLSLVTLLIFAPGGFAMSPVYDLLQRLAGPLVGAVVLAAWLIGSYRRSRNNRGANHG